MEKIEPRILSGFVNFLPREQQAFNNLVTKVRETYETYGFLPLDTSIVDLAEILLAKAGGETEKQIYQMKKGDTNLALRFDLTVPLAKYVAKNYYQLKFPYRAYQIGRVYRGERAQRGRFREFYQADADIIGDNELNIINDAEIIVLIYHVFKAININRFLIKINNRKIYSGLLTVLGLSDKSTDILRTIDKASKIGIEGVKKEFYKLNLLDADINLLVELITLEGDFDQIIKKLQTINNNQNDIFTEGIVELKELTQYLKAFNVDKNNYQIDLSITRGLDYYTGTVFETVLKGREDMGSICGGGRYDNLVSNYSNKKLPGVGMAIGLNRLFYVLNEVNLLDNTKIPSLDILVAPLTNDLSYSIQVANELRDSGIKTQIYFDKKSLRSQINYANQLEIPYIIFIGEDEEKTKTVALKELKTENQVNVSLEEAIKKIKDNNKVEQ